MCGKRFVSTLTVGLMLFGAGQVLAAEDAGPTDAELLAECRKYAIEDEIPKDKVADYLPRCVQDLKESQSPQGTEGPNGHPQEEVYPDKPSET